MKTIAIDFDATISEYTGYKGKGVFGLPLPGAVKYINRLHNQGNTIIINTTRSEIHLVSQYLTDWNIPYDYINFNLENIKQDLSDKKVLADVYIDDRSLVFTGEWTEDYVNKIIAFKPWWRK